MGVTFTAKEASASLTERILDSLGITADNIEDIQTVSAARLQEAATDALQATGEEFQIPAALGEGYSMEWGPVVEGDFLPTSPVTDDPLADQVSQVWVNFARNGVPSAEGMPEWEPYTRQGGATMLLDDEPELVHHHDRELMELLAPDYEY